MVFVGELAVAEIIMLVIFWHAFMAFVIPVFIGKHLLAGSQETIVVASWDKPSNEWVSSVGSSEEHRTSVYYNEQSVNWS